ncbi:hypothetical protein PHAVU_004G101214 [Phaseolus vulgaris]
MLKRESFTRISSGVFWTSKYISARVIQATGSSPSNSGSFTFFPASRDSLEGESPPEFPLDASPSLFPSFSLLSFARTRLCCCICSDWSCICRTNALSVEVTCPTWVSKASIRSPILGVGGFLGIDGLLRAGSLSGRSDQFNGMQIK